MRGEDELRWGVRKKLEFIDLRLFWEGWINRSDLIEEFGISPAQATTDLALYERLAPTNMTYDRFAKRYRRADGFGTVFITPDLDAHLRGLIGMEARAIEVGRTQFDALVSADEAALPSRSMEPMVLMKVLDAIRERLVISVRRSIPRSAAEREIAPHAVFQAAGRWYVRCWSQDDGHFRDVDIHEITAATPVDRAEVDRALDLEWVHRIDLVIVPNPGMPVERRRAVAASYGMEDGRLVRPCRLCLSRHLMMAYGLDIEPGLLAPERQQIVLANKEEVERAHVSVRQLASEALARSQAHPTPRRARATHRES